MCGEGQNAAIYSALYHIVQRSGPAISISTVEDPVEFNLPMISQAMINPAQDFTYPKALRSLMRQDPQVIMVGEIRDPETAAIAVQAGLTGHLVISTIHSGITAGVYARMINMNIEPFLLASSIIAVLSIRLVRKNCTFCTQTYQPEPALLRLVPPELLSTTEFRKGTGCAECLHTGYSGRTALTELLVADYLDAHPILVQVLLERAQEAVHGNAHMNCELCQYRVQLPGFEAAVGKPQYAHHQPAQATVSQRSLLTLIRKLVSR